MRGEISEIAPTGHGGQEHSAGAAQVENLGHQTSETFTVKRQIKGEKICCSCQEKTFI
jgi:hypothetical protein